MIWTATIVTFLATAAVVLTLTYAFSSGPHGVAERLMQLWSPLRPRRDGRFKDKQKERVERMLANLGKIMPAQGKGLWRTRRLLVRAGYRRPEAIYALQGAKVLMPAILAGVFYFTGFFRVNPIFATALAGVGGFLLPDFWVSAKVRRRQHRIQRGLPDALDLLVVTVEAGLGLDQAILRVSDELKIAHPELSEEFQLVNLEMRVGKSRVEALRALGERTGVEDIKALVAMLIQTDRFGTSVAKSLRVHSDNLRTKRRQRAEEMAAKTTVKMIPPLVFFIFPALFVVILGPGVISLLRQLLPALRQ